MIKKCAFLLMLIIVSLFSVAQKIKMEIVMGDKKVGEINAEKITNGKSAQYDMNSHVQASMMITVKVDIVSKSYWYNGMLTNSRATRNSNMPGQDQVTVVELKGKEYLVTRNNAKTYEPYPVRLTVTNLYFQEPVKDTAVFSEIQGMYLLITHLGNHRYQLNQPKGKKDIYVYQNDKLQKIETIIAGKNVVFMVKQGS